MNACSSIQVSNEMRSFKQRKIPVAQQVFPARLSLTMSLRWGGMFQGRQVLAVSPGSIFSTRSKNYRGLFSCAVDLVCGGLVYCLAIAFVSPSVAAAGDDGIECLRPGTEGNENAAFSSENAEYLQNFILHQFRCRSPNDSDSSDLRQLAGSCDGRIQKWRTQIKYYAEGWDVPRDEVDAIFDNFSAASGVESDWTFFSSRANVEILFRSKSLAEREFSLRSGNENPAMLSRFEAFVRGEDNGCAGFSSRDAEGYVEKYILYVSAERDLDEQLYCLNDGVARMFGLNSAEFLSAKTSAGVSIKPQAHEAIRVLYKAGVTPDMSASDIVEKFCRRKMDER